MSCGRAREIDLAGYLVEPDASEWREFREHFTECDDCSAEVAAWTRLEASLRDSGDAPQGAHPEPAALLRYDRERRSLPAVELRQIDQHVRDCRPCADELAALREFDFEAVTAPQGALARAARSLRGLFAGGGGESARGDGGDVLAARRPAVALQDSDHIASAAPPRFALAIIAGELAGPERVVELPLGEIRIGRASECGVRLRDPEAPRVAAHLTVTDAGVVQLRSANERKPIRVNGAPMPAGELAPGDVLEIGEQRLELRERDSR